VFEHGGRKNICESEGGKMMGKKWMEWGCLFSDKAG
jgi:hypothetical protein